MPTSASLKATEGSVVKITCVLLELFVSGSVFVGYCYCNKYCHKRADHVTILWEDLARAKRSTKTQVG